MILSSTLLCFLFQFFNSPGGTNTDEALTSTPVCTRTHAHTPTVKRSNDTTDQLCTPKVKCEPSTPISKDSLFHTPSVKVCEEKDPKTPTPFKKALADLEKKSGVVRTEVGVTAEKFVINDELHTSRFQDWKELHASCFCYSACMP